jgi:type IV secretion system protein VirB10
MQLNRRLSKGVVVSSVVQPVKPSPREYITQQDYDPQAAPGNAHVTLPIDLERMITSFQSIPCVLENSINSQHPGQAVCIVEQNVYSYHGFRHRYVLIPGGSKFQGSYTPLAKQGDTRLSILWQRLLKPDGSMLMLPDGLPTQDAMGRTSLPGEIDNRMWEQFGTPILLTALTALASELVPQGTEGLSGAEQILVEGESRIVTQMLSNNLDLKPIMTIPTGSRLTVKPTIDLIFEPTRIRVLGSSSGVKQASLAENEGSNSQSVDDQGSSSGPPSLAAQPTTH